MHLGHFGAQETSASDLHLGSVSRRLDTNFLLWYESLHVSYLRSALLANMPGKKMPGKNVNLQYIIHASPTFVYTIHPGPSVYFQT